MGAFFGKTPLVGMVTTLLIAVWFAAPAHAATYTVGTIADNTGTCQPTSGTCSLRQLIDYEDALASTPSPPDTIVVPAGDEIDLGSGELTITRSVSIVGGGASTTDVLQLSESPDRVFYVEDTGSPPNVTVPNVTISGLWIGDGTANANNGYFGGNIENQGILTLSGDAIVGGSTTAGSGGGIGNDGGTVTVTDSLIYDNSSTDAEAGGDSGGIQNYGPNPVTGTPGTLTVENSTIANNSSALGGGIYSWCNGEDSACSASGTATNTTTIIDSTIADNDGGTRGTTGGGLLSAEGTVSVENSIVADNTVDNPSSGTASNCGATSPGVITSFGYNLESGIDCGFNSTGDLHNANPEFTSTLPSGTSRPWDVRDTRDLRHQTGFIVGNDRSRSKVNDAAGCVKHVRLGIELVGVHCNPGLRFRERNHGGQFPLSLTSPRPLIPLVALFSILDLRQVKKRLHYPLALPTMASR